MNQDERDEINEIAQKIIAHIEGAQTHSVGMLTYDSIRRARKRLDDGLNTESGLFGKRPSWIIIDELVNVEPMNCTLDEVTLDSLAQAIDDDIFKLHHERFGYLHDLPTPTMEEEPKEKKAKWKQDKSPFGRLNQSRKAKGL